LFEQERPVGILNSVNWLKRIIALALVAVWPLAMNHCKLETVPGFTFLQCAVDTQDTHDADKDCADRCAVEKSQYRADHVPLNIPTPNLLPVFSATALPTLAALPAEVSGGILTAAPPQLLQTRHFASRAALPARAPSFVS
jgi:hypothetical protein